MRFGGMRPGMTVYDVMSKKTGERTVIEIRPITIASCDQVRKTVVGKNADGAARLYREADYKAWRARKPIVICDPTSGMRIVKREESALSSVEMNFAFA
jgi:hypothetical protein